MEYVHWIAQVNSTLSRLTGRTMTAEDLDYEWLEAHLVGENPEVAAKAALARAGRARLRERGVLQVREMAAAYGLQLAELIERQPLPDLSDTDLLALVIGGPVAIVSAERLLEAVGHDLKQIYGAPLQELAGNYAGIGQATARRLKAALELGRRLTQPEVRQRITCPLDAYQHFVRQGLPLLEQEELWVMSLDTKNRITNLSRVYQGNVNTSIIRIGEVLRTPIRVNAKSIIIAHNHPSGETDPSPEDVTVTRQVVQMARTLDIDMLDHFIIGRAGYVSLKERGLGFD